MIALYCLFLALLSTELKASTRSPHAWPQHQSVDAATPEELGALMYTNAVAPIRTARRLLPLVADAGTVAFMSSNMGSIAGNLSGGMDLYRASKAALNSLTRGFLAKDVGLLYVLVIVRLARRLRCSPCIPVGYGPQWAGPTLLSRLMRAWPDSPTSSRRTLRLATIFSTIRARSYRGEEQTVWTASPAI